MNVCSRMSRALAVSAVLFGSQVFADDTTTEPAQSKLRDYPTDSTGRPLQTYGSVNLPRHRQWINAPALGAAQFIGQIEAFELAVETPTQAAPAEFSIEIQPFAPVNSNGLPHQFFGQVSLPRISRSTTEATLGEPQFIGWLPSPAEVEVQGISLEEPFLGPPILLASLDDESADAATAIPASDPEQIQHHLQQSIRLLAAAGLPEQSQGIRSILDEFRTNHRDRLSLNKKRAELAALQAEIAQLSHQLNDGLERGQVTIELKICEVDKDALSDTPQSLTIEEFKKLHEGWAAKKVINPLSNPKIRSMHGQQAEVHIGAAQQKVAESEVNLQPGISVSLVPTILDDRRVRAAITSERTELAGSDKQPLVSRSKIQAESELSLDRVVWFSLGETATDPNKVAIVWAALTDIGPLKKTAQSDDQQGGGVTPAGFSAPR